MNRHNNNAAHRLEERTKSLFYTGATLDNFSTLVDAITINQVQEAVTKALKSKLTFVAQGGEVSHLPSYEQISKLFA